MVTAQDETTLCLCVPDDWVGFDIRMYAIAKHSEWGGIDDIEVEGAGACPIRPGYKHLNVRAIR